MTDTTELGLQTSVGHWVARHPQTSRVFESLRIDYCCGGEASLEQACQQRNLSPSDVLSQLEQAVEAGGAESAENWLDAPLSSLCDHIEQTHHAYLQGELPGLTDLIRKVLDAHAEAHPELARIAQLFAQLRGELEPHMMKEERILFPAIRELERSDTLPMFPFGTLANPIRVMEQEHEFAGDALATIRQLTSNFQVPEDACNAYRAMLDRLQALEADMHHHVHKENNILFPRAIAAEQTRATR